MKPELIAYQHNTFSGTTSLFYTCEPHKVLHCVVEDVSHLQSMMSEMGVECLGPSVNPSEWMNSKRVALSEKPESEIKISSRKSVPFKQVWETLKLKEHSLYRVEVSMSVGNPNHTAFLFTGFDTGSYCSVYNTSYGDPVSLLECRWIRILEDMGSTK